MRNRKGFTLIELLVVIAIIGLLSTIAVVALNSARSKSRDAKRVADIKQIQTALELAFAETNGYPVSATGTVLGAGSAKVLCNNNDTAVFQADTTGCSTVFMPLIPENQTPGGSDYSYGGTASDYLITFTLEGKVGSLNSGLVNATPAGMTN
jgi:prepilin-type N-terminal cleavage/methylation domain-containing protein